MYSITGLYSYPIKGCRGTLEQNVILSPEGIEGDRQLVVLSQGVIVNQLKLPRLARVEPKRISKNHLQLSVNDMPVIDCPISYNGYSITTDLYGNVITVIQQSDMINQWLSEVVGETVILAALERGFIRDIPLDEFSLHDGQQQDKFVDLAPILLTNENSLCDLNQRLPDPIPMNRFRPNIVINGAPSYAEDNISGYSTNGLNLKRSGACERCAITCTDQLTGERLSQPLKTLRAYRKRDNAYASGIVFGAYMAVEGKATIALGDTLSALDVI